MDISFELNELSPARLLRTTLFAVGFIFPCFTPWTIFYVTLAEELHHAQPVNLYA